MISDAGLDLMEDFGQPELVLQRKRNRREEDKLHRAIWRDLQGLLHPEVVVWSTENRQVGMIEGQRRRARGCIRGVPDMTFHWPHAHSAYVELKIKGSYPSEDQKRLHLRLRAAGIETAVCRSLHEVLQFLHHQGCPLRVRNW